MPHYGFQDMELSDAISLLEHPSFASLPSTTWADLGCGDGTFTLALAERLLPGSIIHAMDRDGAALRKIPKEHNRVRITTHRGDFASGAWPFGDLDGILMANSLHYVADQARFIRACEPRMKSRRFLIVEYDTDAANRWVPYPVSKTRLTTLFTAAGYSSIEFLGSRPSVFRRAALYGALVTSGPDPNRESTRA
jgi:SAM-dependent methyltransferase